MLRNNEIPSENRESRERTSLLIDTHLQLLFKDTTTTDACDSHVIHTDQVLHSTLARECKTPGSAMSRMDRGL